METGSLPWKAMFRCLEAIGGKRCRKDMCSAVLAELESLLAYDMGYLFLFDARGRLSCCETRRVDERRKRQYFDYYMRIDPCRRATPVSSGCMYTDWSCFCDTEFYTDFGRPQGVRYSAGMQLHRDNGSLLGVLFLTRSGARGFGPCELALLEALCPQVENLLLLVCAAEERLLLAAGGAALLELLSPRERQIAGLVCRGHSTKTIASSLLLTPATVYRHVSNIFEKAGVHSRGELVARVYGTRER
jgi:DNA-binding CsgD family transcriptional regulator